MHPIQFIKNKFYLAGIIMVFILIYFLPATRSMELFTYDIRSSLRSLINSESQVLQSKIILVNLDTATLKANGGLPLAPGMVKQFIDRAYDLGAKAVVVGVPLGNKQEAAIYDYNLTKTLKSQLPLFLTGFLNNHPMNLSQYQIELPDTRLLKSAAGIGFTSVVTDSDLVCRKGKPYVQIEGKTFDSIALVLAKYLKSGDKAASYKPNRLIFGHKTFYTDSDHNLLTTYRHLSLRKIIPAVSWDDFLNKQKDVDMVSKVAYLALDASGYHDSFRVPNWFEPYLNTAYINLNLMDDLLAGKSIVAFPPWLELIFVLGIGLFCCYIVFKYNNLYGVLTGFTVFIGYVALNFTLFYAGFWLSLAAPFLGIVLCAGGGLVYGMILRLSKSHAILTQFIHSEMVEEMLADEDSATKLIEEKEVTILFADIKGYTTMAERKTPKEVIEILNEYYVDMAKILARNYGMVYNYQGDAVMVVFSKTGENNGYLAIKAANEMQVAFDYMRRKWQLENRELFTVGIGICSGPVALGFLGTKDFRQYVAIGDAVNIAARLEDLSKKHRRSLVIAESTYNEARDFLDAELIDKLHLKGKFKALDVYAVKVLKLENGEEVQIERPDKANEGE